MKLTIKNITKNLPSNNPKKNTTIFLEFQDRQLKQRLEIKPNEFKTIEINSKTTQICKYEKMGLIEISDPIQKKQIKTTQEEQQLQIIENETIIQQEEDIDKTKVKKTKIQTEFKTKQ